MLRTDRLASLSNEAARTVGKTRDFAVYVAELMCDIMTVDTSSYAWLVDRPAPRMISEALGLWRDLRTAGKTLCDVIAKWEGECLGRTVKPVVLDPVAFSGTLVAVVARRSRKSLPAAPHCALNWTLFGVAAGQPQLGDVLCFMRETGAYVGLYIGEDDVAYHVLGADEADGISIFRLPKRELYAARRPVYQDAERSIRPIGLNRDGTLKTAG